MALYPLCSATYKSDPINNSSSIICLIIPICFCVDKYSNNCVMSILGIMFTCSNSNFPPKIDTECTVNQKYYSTQNGTQWFVKHTWLTNTPQSYEFSCIGTSCIIWNYEQGTIFNAHFTTMWMYCQFSQSRLSWPVSSHVLSKNDLQIRNKVCKIIVCHW